MRLFRLVALIVAPVVLAPLPASAFKSFGFSSGMTPDQVRAAAPKGYGLRLNGDFGFIEKGPDLYATVTFCKGRLASLSKTIDAQSEWFALADEFRKAHGNPKVNPAVNPAPQAGAGEGVEMSWRAGRTKYALANWPASIKPGARPTPTATVSFTDFAQADHCLAGVRHGPAKARVTKAGARRGTKHRPGAVHPVIYHRPPQDGAYSISPDGMRIQTTMGEASVRYTTQVRVDDAPQRAPPPPAAKPDPIQRFFNYMKAHFGGGGQVEQAKD